MKQYIETIELFEEQVIDKNLLNKLDACDGMVLTRPENSILAPAMAVHARNERDYVLKTPRLTVQEQEELIELFYECQISDCWDDIAVFADVILRKQIGLRQRESNDNN